jgi:hypothetical protein
MLENHLPGSATGGAKRYDATRGGSLRNGSVEAGRSRPMRQPDSENKPLARVATTASAMDREQTGFWSLLVNSLMEGLALYGASMHSVVLFPTEPDAGEEQSPAPRDVAVRRWRGPIRVISSTQDTASTKCDRDADRVMPAGYVSANRSKREREIQEASAALARLDDRTLLNLGIPHRCYIEQTVRYCRDC